MITTVMMSIKSFSTHHQGFDLESRCQGDECLVAMCSLVKVPSVALMLPGPLTDDMKHALEKISDAGVLAEI